MAVNSLIFEEGSEIVVDTEVEAPAAGWALNYVGVRRAGGGVQVHIEATNNAGAAALVCTLPADFAPGATITSPDGNWTVGANGQVSYNGSRAASALHVLGVTYLAGQQSP